MPRPCCALVAPLLRTAKSGGFTVGPLRSLDEVGGPAGGVRRASVGAQRSARISGTAQRDARRSTASTLMSQLGRWVSVSGCLPAVGGGVGGPGACHVRRGGRRLGWGPRGGRCHGRRRGSECLRGSGRGGVGVARRRGRGFCRGLGAPCPAVARPGPHAQPGHRVARPRLGGSASARGVPARGRPAHATGVGSDLAAGDRIAPPPARRRPVRGHGAAAARCGPCSAAPARPGRQPAPARRRGRRRGPGPSAAG